MGGSFGRSRRHLVIPAGMLVLLAGMSAPRAAEPADLVAPLPEEADLRETLPIDVSASENIARESPEEISPTPMADAHFPASPPPRYPVVPQCEQYRPTRIFRSEILGRLWVRGEYLAWAPKEVDLPALVTRSTAADPASTTVLFGDSGVFQEMSSGGRLTGGFGWTPQQLSGIEASYFELDGDDKELNAKGGNNKILARPFFNVEDDLPSGLLVTYPGVLDGTIDVRADMELSGAECLWRRMALCRGNFRLDFVAGYRYGRLFDRVDTAESLVSLDPASGWDADTLIHRFDSFVSANDFHGGEIGLVGRWRRSRWSVDGKGKIALGNTTMNTTIDGGTQTSRTVDPGPPEEMATTSDPGGLLALPTNMGRYRQSDSAVMSEVEVAVRYELTPDLWLRFGYNLLTWSRVARAADQIDLDVNPSQIPPGNLIGEARPTFALATTSFWAQGLTVGLEHQF